MTKKKLKHFGIFLKELSLTIENLNIKKLDEMVEALVKIRNRNGRLFFIGVGGSAANSSHAVNDFRKLCQIESYSCFDNVSEMTARINDEGWDKSIVGWLESSNFKSKDAIFVFSVGGGDQKKNVSVNIINAVRYVKRNQGLIMGIVSKRGGYTYKYGDIVLQIENQNSKLVTPISESLQSVIWHMLVSNPKLQKNNTKW